MVTTQSDSGDQRKDKSIPISASHVSKRDELDPADDFITGNFSAKYHTKTSKAPGASTVTTSTTQQQQQHNIDSQQSSINTELSSIGGSQVGQGPVITMEGFETPSSSLKVLTSRSSNQRRQSILSNLISNNSVISTPGIDHLAASQNDNKDSVKTADKSNSSAIILDDASNADIVNNPPEDIVSIVNRHLVQDTESSLIPLRSNDTNSETRFDSLQLQGGDITRDLYNWVDRHEGRKRANSFSEFSSIGAGGGAEDDMGSSFMDEVSVNDLRVPGGFRRDFVKKHKSVEEGNFLTKNFIEFISIYGHFAGEDIDDDEDDDEDDEENVEGTEYEPLMRSGGAVAGSRYSSFNSTAADLQLQRQNLILKKRLKNRAWASNRKTTSNFKSFLLLLKAFLGTGVLFLPKSFSNGGLLFSNVMIVCFSALSYYCFVTLINVRSKLNVSSYGNLGLVLYGEAFKTIVLLSIIFSQIGFSSAYIVFVATNFAQLLKGNWTLHVLILSQLVVFVPMSLIRKISKLSVVVLISDFFILLGLLYVYYYSIYEIAVSKIDWSNITVGIDSSTWSLFIGTAIFTYEGIGLLIPIHESMTHPENFNKFLLLVMIIITVIFVTIGSISYMAFGNDVQTVILLNFADSEAIQAIYSVAILLSTPLQLFPGIKMIELIWFRQSNGLDKLDPNNIDKSIDAIKSGKRDPRVKFKKNVLRVAVVLLTVAISIIGSNDLDKFVSLIGSFTCVPLIYVFPPLLNLKIQKTDTVKIGEYNININHEGESKYIRYVDYAVLILGIVMMCYTSLTTLSNWIQ